MLSVLALSKMGIGFFSFIFNIEDKTLRRDGHCKQRI